VTAELFYRDTYSTNCNTSAVYYWFVIVIKHRRHV